MIVPKSSLRALKKAIEDRRLCIVVYRNTIEKDQASRNLGTCMETIHKEFDRANITEMKKIEAMRTKMFGAAHLLWISKEVLEDFLTNCPSIVQMAESTTYDASLLTDDVRPSEWDDVEDKGETIYQEKWRRRSEGVYDDQWIAIETGSGEAFINSNQSKAVLAARGKHPHGRVYLRKIGRPYIQRTHA